MAQQHPLGEINTKGWELAVLVAAHLAGSLFVNNLAHGLLQINHAGVREFTKGLYWTYSFLAMGPVPLRLIMSGLIVVLAIRLWQGRSARLGCDILGSILCVRCLMELLVMNLLLIAPLKNGAMLLVQLILFLPVVIINFGWLYWRWDHFSRLQGKPQIKFDEADPDAFDYFHISINTLLQFEPSGAKPLSKRMKALFNIHGVVMMDLVALTLSRAIGLATGGG